MSEQRMRTLKRPTSRKSAEEQVESLLKFCYEFCTIAPLTAVGFSEKDARALLDTYTTQREEGICSPT